MKHRGGKKLFGLGRLGPLIRHCSEARDFSPPGYDNVPTVVKIAQILSVRKDSKVESEKKVDN